MNAEALARLRNIARGQLQAGLGLRGVTPTRAITPKKRGVTPATPVTRKNDDSRPATAEVHSTGLSGREKADAHAIEERAGLAADGVPSVYLDAWARLNCQKPASVSDAEWRLALDDGGRFLDAWGSDAADAGWTPGDLFDVSAGLVWRMAGERVEAIGADAVRLSDGRVVMRRILGKRLARENPND
jgi:hypothetical protein